MKKGFTLIEILVVTTIIVLLTSIAAVSYSQFSKSSRDARRKTDLEQVRAALEMYRSNNDQYSSSSFDNTCNFVNWLNLYIGSLPTDPKTSYNYRCTISTNDYTLGAYLESGGSGVCGSCGASNCNYCLGPYGQR